MPKIDREPCGVEVPEIDGTFRAWEAPSARKCRRRDFSVWFTDEAISMREREDMSDRGAIDLKIALRKARNR